MLFATLRTKTPNYWIRHSVVSGRQWMLEQFSLSSLKFLSTVLHSQFRFWMVKGHFTIERIRESVLDRYERSMTYLQPGICTMVSPRDQKPFTSPDGSSRAYSRILRTRLYIRPTHWSFLNHLSLFLMMITSPAMKSCSSFQLWRLLAAACARTTRTHAIYIGTCHTTVVR